MFSTLGAESDRKCASEASSPELTGPDDTMFSTLGAVSDRKCASEASSPEFTGPDDTMFSSPGAMSDIILVVEDKKLHVSKCVLGLASSVFLRMFEGDYKGRTEIPLVDKKYEDVVELLLCIYPSTTKKVTRSNLDTVLPLADEYGIDSLKQRCEDFVLVLFQHKEDKFCNPPNNELVHLLYMADKYKLKELLNACVEKVKFRTYEGEHGIKSFAEFSQMSLETKFRVLSERMGQLEIPFRKILVTAIKKPIDQMIKYIVTPDCPRCTDPRSPQSQPSTFGFGVSTSNTTHVLGMKCRDTSVADLKALSKQVYDLSDKFYKDPDCQKQPNV